MILYTRQEDTRKMKIVDEYFGCDVFSTSAMQRYLPHAVYKQMMDVMEKGKELPKEIADVVANAMKDWAMDKGATHYTHWFQPMTGITAEKHDAFISKWRIACHIRSQRIYRMGSNFSSFCQRKDFIYSNFILLLRW